MQKKIEYNSNVHTKSEKEVASEKETDLDKFGYGDLRSVGRLCVRMLRAKVVAKIRFTRSIYAASPPEPPERPKPMRYKDLPIYESPHADYKDYEADKQRCQKINTKVIHNYIYPYVSTYRKEIGGTLSNVKNEIIDTYNEVTTDFRKAQKSIKCYMRDPANDTSRKSFMAISGATGFYLGMGGGVSRRLLFSSLGIIAAGSICYPKETDEGCRTVLYYAGKGLVAAYNSFNKKDHAFRDPLPCIKDSPKIPPPNKTFKDCQALK